LAPHSVEDLTPFIVEDHINLEKFLLPTDCL
jgi:hypothetical protein